MVKEWMMVGEWMMVEGGSKEQTPIERKKIQTVAVKYLQSLTSILYEAVQAIRESHSRSISCL